MIIFALPLVLALYGGWPSLVFVYYRFHHGYPVAQALYRMLVPGLVVAFMPLLISKAGLVPQDPAPWIKVLAFCFGMLWFVAPYFFLARWAIRAFQRRFPPDHPTA